MDEASAKRAVEQARAGLLDAEIDAAHAHDMVGKIEVGAPGDLALATIGQALATLALRDTVAVAVGLLVLIMEGEAS